MNDFNLMHNHPLNINDQMFASKARECRRNLRAGDSLTLQKHWDVTNNDINKISEPSRYTRSVRVNL